MAGLEKIKFIEELDIAGKNVFLRLDLNVPLRHGDTIEVTDTTRIDAALPTIQYCLDNKCKLVIGSHLGRPKSPADRQLCSLEPIAKILNEKLNVEVTLIEDPESDAPNLLVGGLNEKKIILLENLRFSDSETKNGKQLAEAIAKYTEVYINDAFGACHRAHSSIAALPELIKIKGIGFLIKTEVEMLDKVVNSEDSPFMTIVGGAKVSDKMGLLDKLLDRVDVFIIGGAMAYTFLKAQGKAVGQSLVEEPRLNFAKSFLTRAKTREKKVLLPIDHVIASNIHSENGSIVTAIPEDKMALDIGPKTTEIYMAEIKKAKVVFWNGPMGLFESKSFAVGTNSIARAVSEVQGTTIIGGGDSAAAVKASGFAEKVSHISTGGGASLEYLQGNKLPGLEVLRQLQRESADPMS